MARARKGVRLLDFDGLYGDDPFSRPRRGKVVDVFKGLSEQGGRRRRKAGSVSSSMRAATGSPEAVVKLASWGSGAASARDQLNYISREGELELEMSDGTTIESREEIRDLVDAWSDRFSHRKDGRARNTVHFVLSTPPETDREATLEAGRDWARETFGEKHEYALVAHNDTEHPHVHIVAEVKGRDRSRFTVGPSDFHDMRERFAEKCRDRGIEMNATRRDVRGAARGESMALRKMREEGRTPRIDGIAQRQVSEHGADKPNARSHPAKAAREERLRYVAGEHRALAHRLSMGDLAAMDDQRPGQVAASKALRGLAGHLERGGDTARPDRVYGAERVEREVVPVAAANADKPMKVEPTEGQASSAVEIIDKARMTAQEILENLAPGAQRDTVLEQIAILDKSSAALRERAGQGGDRGGGGHNEPDSDDRRSSDPPDTRPMSKSDRDLAEIRARLDREERQRREGRKPTERDRDRERDMDRDR